MTDLRFDELNKLFQSISKKEIVGFVISYHAWKLQEVWQKLRTATQEKAVQGFCTAFLVG